MSTDLPLWFGRERGIDLSALAEWDEEDEGQDGGFIGDFGAGLLGLLAPAALVASLVGAGHLPLAAVVGLIMAGTAWLAGGIAAGWAVAFCEEAPPAWAHIYTRVLITFGKIIAFASVVIVVVIALAMLLAIIFGAAASDRR
jgi:hypothetical protein